MQEQKFTIRKKGDITIKTRDGRSDRSIWNQDFISNHYRIDKNYGVVVDIGAHIGTTSILSASYGAKVFSYEPEQKTYNLMLENIALNKMENLITPFMIAVGKPGKAKIYTHWSNDGANSLFMDKKNIIGEQDIDVISLTSVFHNNNITHCGLLKIDAEHAERDIFDNFDLELLKIIDRIVIEIHDKVDREYIPKLLEKTHKLLFTEDKNFFFERIEEKKEITDKEVGTSKQVIKELLKSTGRSNTYKITKDGKTFIRKESEDEYCGINIIRDVSIIYNLPWVTKILQQGKVGNIYYRDNLYYEESHRLDKYKKNLNHEERISIASDILNAILDMYIYGVCHRDVHDKNIFIEDGQIKIIDYEFFEFLQDPKPLFLNSYDITGTGLKSPKNTQNMCFTKDHPNAILKSLGVSMDEAIKGLREKLLKELISSSTGFKSVNGIHNRSIGSMYSSFNLPEFTVSKDISQRDTEKRLKNFGITERDIKNKTVLDLGSNIGSILFSIQKYEPKESFGIEFDKDKVKIAKKIAAFSGLNTCSFKEYNIDNIVEVDRQEFFKHGEDLSLINISDVVFALSINKHVNESRLYDLLGNITKETLYFEANVGTKKEDVFDNLDRVGFKTILYMGECDDDMNKSNNHRMMFIARKY